MSRHAFIFLLSIVSGFLFFTAPSVAQDGGRLVIEEKEFGLELRIEDKTLSETLDAIHEKTGIRFKISESLKNDPVFVRLKAPDWKTGLDMLLDPYDKLVIWNDRLDKSQVHILARLEGDLPPASPGVPVQEPVKSDRPPIAGSEPPAQPLEGPFKPFPKLDRSKLPTTLGLDPRQLRKVSKGELKSPLPLHLIMDPNLRPYLKQFGIHSSRDLEDPVKAMKVRVHARRALAEKSAK